MAATLEVESTLTDRYQTTVPETVRRALRLGKRDKIHYTIRPGGEVVLSRVAAAEEAPQHDVFGGNGGIGFQFEDPVAVGLLAAQQRFACQAHGTFQRSVAMPGLPQIDVRQAVQIRAVPRRPRRQPPIIRKRPLCEALRAPGTTPSPPHPATDHGCQCSTGTPQGRTGDGVESNPFQEQRNE